MAWARAARPRARPARPVRRRVMRDAVADGIPLRKRFRFRVCTITRYANSKFRRDTSTTHATRHGHKGLAHTAARRRCHVSRGVVRRGVRSTARHAARRSIDGGPDGTAERCDSPRSRVGTHTQSTRIISPQGTSALPPTRDARHPARTAHAVGSLRALLASGVQAPGRPSLHTRARHSPSTTAAIRLQRCTPPHLTAFSLSLSLSLSRNTTSTLPARVHSPREASPTPSRPL